MIKHIVIENFKSIHCLETELKNLTILTGLNCSGKSTFLQAIRTVFNSKNQEKPLLDDYGQLHEVLYKQQIVKDTTSEIQSLSIDILFSDTTSAQIYFSETVSHFRYPGEGHKFSFLSADRLGPQKFLPIQNLFHKKFSVGEKGEFVADCLHEHENIAVPDLLKHTESQGETLQFNVNGWLNVIAPGFEIKTQLFAKQDLSATTFNGFRPHNVGFGLSYTLPIIVSVLGLASLNQTNKGHILAIENPEAHLHPRGQTELGKFLALAAATGLQIIVETHSDYIIDGARLAIRDGKLKHSDTLIAYCYLDNNQETQLRPIFPDSKGRLSDWPTGFFDQNRINKAELAGM